MSHRRFMPSFQLVVLLTVATCAAVQVPATAQIFVPTDQATIALGLNEALMQGEELVLVEPGDYYEQNLNVPADVTLMGAGAAHTRIIAAASSAAVWLQPGSALAHFTIEGGYEGVVWNGGGSGEFAVQDCWFVDQGAEPLRMPGGATVELRFERNVIVRPSSVVELYVSGDSIVTIRNNHFVGTGSESYLELWVDGNSGGQFEIRNNIFENGLYAASVWLEPSFYVWAVFSNNVFNLNESGLEVVCGSEDIGSLDAMNNWFVSNALGLNASSCDGNMYADTWHDYNGFWDNTADIDSGDLGGNSFTGTAPLFAGVAPNDSHGDDDYSLLTGSPGIGDGNPDTMYLDPDGTICDVGAYGGPYALDWNWDGDPVPLLVGDCDDRDALRFPNSDEKCDGIDNDCDGNVPADETTDGDNDGWFECNDCDDSNAQTYPGATEVCDGEDNDCDGSVNEDEEDNDFDGAAECEGDCDDGDASLNLLDSDGDGYTSCDHDCDDGYAPTYPGATEECDGIDNDCDGEVPQNETIDDDGDGHPQCSDCDDGCASTFPGASEICDGLDNDCDQFVPEDEMDNDSDGYMPCAGDCDDTRPDLNPDDVDGDGYSGCNGDCDTGNPDMYPNAPELCDGADTDCDGAIPTNENDDDGDGVRKCEGDCDDADPDVSPDIVEVCDDGKDNDCDGLKDEEDDECGGGDDDTSETDDDTSEADDDTGVGDDEDLPAGFHCECRSGGTPAPAGWVLLLLSLVWGKRRGGRARS